MIKYKNTFIKNVYYMLAYAFNHLNQKDIQKVEAEAFEHIHNLFASILLKGVGKQIKQGLFKEYIPYRESITVSRGKIDIYHSIFHRLSGKQILQCEYDELSENNLLNQVLKISLILLLKHSDVDDKYKTELKKLLQYFSEVEFIEPRTIQWHKIQFHRSNHSYQFLIFLCKLMIQGMLMSSEEGNYKLASFIDDKEMHYLYERFIFEYYRQERKEIKVMSSEIKWALDNDFDEMLPKMKCDIMLSKGDRLLIIDAKFYATVTQSHHETHKIHSHNLYQIFSYVKNKQAESSKVSVAGLLLYARTDQQIQPEHHYQMSGNLISVTTLDLNCDFTQIKAQLDKITDQYFI